MSAHAKFALLTLATLLLPACAGDSALNPAGTQAQHIAGLFWVFFDITLVVFWIVMAVMLVAVLRRRALANLAADTPDIHPDQTREHRARRTIIGGVSITVVILFIFLLADFFVGRAISATPQNAMRIKVTGHQWWWEIQYKYIPWEKDGGYPSGVFNAANEIHIPVGQPVILELESRDVNHSFWVPRLHGKRDLIPGQPTTTWIQADQPGTFTGRCAEYCGAQHANMQIWVVAQSTDDFDHWLAGQRQAAADPQQANLQHGRAVFLGASCILCHTVQGTPANGRAAPDLSHVGSRQAIAAGALKTTHENLAAWVNDPQSIKPGVKMPQNPMNPDDLNALVDWLQSLK